MTDDSTAPFTKERSTKKEQINAPIMLKERIQRLQNLILVNSPGMRMIKTSLAVTICLLISYFFSVDTAVQSSIATIVCLAQDIKNTWRVSKNRLIGTLIAGLYAYLFILFVVLFLEIQPLSIGYLIVTGLFVIPLISLLVKINKPGGVVIAAIVYVIIALNIEGQAEHPLRYVGIRLLHTLIGVAVAMFVNWFPPLNYLGRRLKKVQMRANHRAEELEAILHEAMNLDDEDIDVIVKRKDGTTLSQRTIRCSQHHPAEEDPQVGYLDPADPVVTMPEEAIPPDHDPYDPPQISEALDVYDTQAEDEKTLSQMVAKEEKPET
ncbi:MAG TPA: hypothetical protein GX717_00365 [Clostridiaceae bacterium]|nr:hypothetical protein [Clostridiaceae bacterium]